MKDSPSVGTVCYKLSENVSQQMVFLHVCCLINLSRGHSSEDLNCFRYPQLPFITSGGGYFTLAGGLNLTGTAPKRFMLGGEIHRLHKWVWIGRWDGRDLRSSQLCNRAHGELTSVQAACVVPPSCLCREPASAASSQQTPTGLFRVGSLVVKLEFFSCKKHKAPQLSRHCTRRDLEPELER